MKNYLYLIVLFLLSFNLNSQTIGGTLATGVTKIPRVSGYKTNSISSSTALAATNEVITPTGVSTEVGITEGALSVSLTGAANYNIPILVPQGINGVEPKISLNYNSQGGNGIAGYGWEISGISAITRIPSTKFHDATIDAVDFDNLDRFALDGQRLILKNPTGTSYLFNGALFETENFSNIKITYVTSTVNYFFVEYPDGSSAKYGTTVESQSNSLGITEWKSAQGNMITYTYVKENNVSRITAINYGYYAGSPVNTINFLYNTTASRVRTEQQYINGNEYLSNKILTEINTNTFTNVLYRKYLLTYDTGTTTLGFQRLDRITESTITGGVTKSYNPTVFTYGSTPETNTYGSIGASLTVGNVNLSSHETVSGDFDGDGKMDFLLYPTTGVDAKAKYWTFIDNTNPSSLLIDYLHNVGTFEKIFSMSMLSYQNKLTQQQGWCVVKKSAGQITFNTYFWAPDNIYFQYTKTNAFPLYNGVEIPKEYLSGDFNGDGLTDVVIVNFNNGGSTSSQAGISYFLDLDRRVTTNYINGSGTLAVTNGSKFYVADANGDGKSDIYVISAGIVRIYSLNDTNQLYQLCTLSDAGINVTTIALFGDYNGDGKNDFLIPTAINANTWNRYLSTGTAVIKTTTAYAGPNYLQSSTFITKHYIATDFNHDGKTDIILLSFEAATVNPPTGTGSLYCYPNSISNYSYSVSIPNTSGLNQFNLPYFYNSSRPNESLEIGFIKDNKIYTFTGFKDFNEDKLLKTITTGNGFKEAINYKPLKVEGSGGYANPNIYTIDGWSTQVYPNSDINISPSFKVVSKLERFGNNYKKQFFTYYAGVYSMDGLGFLGFQGTMHTNWFDDAVAGEYMISNVSKFDTTLRGANTLNFTVANYWTSFTSNPSSFISKNEITYNVGYEDIPPFTPVGYVPKPIFEQPLQANKVFKLKKTTIREYDGLNTTSSEVNIVYNANNSPTSTIIKVKNAGVIEQTSTTNITYDVVQTISYVIDRPINKQESVTAYNDTRTTEEQYTYTTSAPLNMIATVKNKSMTSDFITKSFEYDLFGNKTKVTLSAPDLLQSRITNYEYDQATYKARFLTKIIDLELLETTFSYDTNKGYLIGEQKPFANNTYFSYDAWEKKISTTDYLGNITTIAYSNTANNTFTVDTSMSTAHGGARKEVYDLLGRKIISGAKNLQGTMSYVKTEYDNLDRVVKQYEPYILGVTDNLYSYVPSQYSTIAYDPHSRPKVSTSYTGKTESINYNGGLTTEITTVSDGLTTTKTTTTDAIGNMISSTEAPLGGTINYGYYANGFVNTTTYAGNSITTQQDAWGRKNKLIDPSAGTYNYTFNNIGEMVTEETPKGTTTYGYDNFGKVLTKTVVGKATTTPPTTTNTLTTYAYETDSKLLSTTSFNDIENNVITNYLNEYGNFKRPFRVTEKGLASYETKIFYDSFGRPLNQYQKAATLVTGTSTENKFSERWTTNVYKNGFLNKITDGNTTTGTGSILWQMDEVNARGQLTKALYGNGITVLNTYDALDKPTTISHKDGTLDIMTLSNNYTTYPQRYLLSNKTNSIMGSTPYSESYIYDDLNRLTSYPNVAGVTENQIYAESGKILTNSNGTYNYSSILKLYQNTSIDVNPTSKNYYLNSALQQISYSALKKPTTIYQESTTGVAQERLDFLYNVGENRSTMFYGDTNANKMARKLRRYYSTGGTMEITETRDPSGTITATNFTTYIGGDGYTAPVVLKSDGTTQSFLYLHRDLQGSIIGITNQAKQLLERRIFDAWGMLAKLQNSSGQYVINNGQTLIANYNMLLDRGYTGHEHLWGIGIINMNGRLYDPKLHRFLMPDNNLQDPTNSQNFNRYGYVLNNPVNMNDPSGEEGIEDGAKWLYDGFIAVGAWALFHTGKEWDRYEIKDWSHGAFNFNSWSKSAKTISKTFGSALKSLGDNISSLFNWGSNSNGGGRNSGQVGQVISGNINNTGGVNGGGRVTFSPANVYSFAANTSISGGLSMQNANNVPSMYNNYNSNNYDNTGLVTTGLGTAFTAAEIKMYNPNNWYSLKQLKTYGQNFNGNSATGGKISMAKRVSTGFKIGGYSLGAYNATTTFMDYRNGKIGIQSLITEQASNAYSTFGGMYGAAWGVGWEGGRWITKREFYQVWFQESWLPWRIEHWGY